MSDDGYHLDLEQDYEAIYTMGWRPDPYGESTIPVGLCNTMCSHDEMQERERQRRLSKYEIKQNTDPPQVDAKLAMKQYTRSAAGREFTHASNLRPWSVLKQSLHHLLLNICLKDDDWMQICDFVFDRLKSVRQDMIIQRIEGRRCVEVLEGSIRFLVYSMYRLTCTIKDFTQNLPFQVILSPEGSPVSGLNNYEVNVVREMKLTMQCLRDCLHSLIVQYQDHVPDSPNRPLFEAINLIVNLPFLHGQQFCRTNFQSDKDLRNSDSMFKTVFRMYRDHLAGYHLSALKRLPQLMEYPLIVLAYAPAIAQLQVQLLTTLKKLYSSRGPNTAHPGHLCKLICPEWLDISYDERLIFTIFMAIQFGIYNDDKDCCDFNVNFGKRDMIAQDFAEKAQLERKKQLLKENNDNETRIYAMQMIAGRDWSFYQDSLKVYGLEAVLNPTQPESRSA